MTTRARRVPVDEPLVAGRTFDYADAFEVTVPAADRRSPEEWARRGLRLAGPTGGLVVLAHRHLLRFELAPPGSPGHLQGWRIVSSDEEALHLEASGPLTTGTLVARRVSPTSVLLTTTLVHRRPRAAGLVWSALGPVHRTLAPRLLALAVAE